MLTRLSLTHFPLWPSDISLKGGQTGGPFIPLPSSLTSDRIHLRARDDLVVRQNGPWRRSLSLDFGQKHAIFESPPSNEKGIVREQLEMRDAV